MYICMYMKQKNQKKGLVNKLHKVLTLRKYND